MNILWKKSSTTSAASVAFFSFLFMKIQFTTFYIIIFSFILFNPLVDKFVYISLYAKDEEKKIDNKIIVFFSMVNQPKNVFSIKVLCSYGIASSVFLLSHGLVHLYLSHIQKIDEIMSMFMYNISSSKTKQKNILVAFKVRKEKKCRN